MEKYSAFFKLFFHSKESDVVQDIQVWSLYILQFVESMHKTDIYAKNNSGYEKVSYKKVLTNENKSGII